MQLSHAEDSSLGRARRAGSAARRASTRAELGRRRVSRAVARAKQGDREALRFLYIRYADNVYGYVASIVARRARGRGRHAARLREADDRAAEVRAARGPVLGLDPPRRAQRRRRPHARAPAPIPVRGGPRARRAHRRGHSQRPSLDARARRSPRSPRISARSSSCATSSASRPARSPSGSARSEPSIHGLHHRGRGALRSAADRDATAPPRSHERWRRDPHRHALTTQPIPVTRLDQADPALLEELLEVVARVARQGAFTDGRRARGLRGRVRRLLRRAHAVGVSSGTEAISLALRALGHRPRRRGHRARRTRSSPRRKPSARSAPTPKLVDVDPDTHLITAEHVAAAIGPRTRGGDPCPPHGLDRRPRPDPRRRRARTDLRVIEDTAQAHGADHDGRRVGTHRRHRLLLVLPDQEPRRLGRRRRDRHRRRRPRRAGAPAALARRAAALPPPAWSARPRAWTRCRPRCCASSCAGSTAGNADRRRARRRAARRASRARASSCPARPSRGADHVYHLFIVRVGAPRRAARAPRRARRLDRGALPVPDPSHRGLRRSRPGRAACPSPSGSRSEICTLPLFPTMSDDEVAGAGSFRLGPFGINHPAAVVYEPGPTP